MTDSLPHPIVDGPAAGDDARDRRIAELEAQLAARGSDGRDKPALDRIVRFLPFYALSHLFVTVPAFLISIAVGYFTFVQADATQKMQVASVWPRVTYNNANVSDGDRSKITLSLVNKGVGPAIIGGLRVEYNGKAYADPRSLLDACCGAAGARLALGLSNVDGEVLRPGEEMMVTELNRRKTPADVYERFNRERSKLSVSVCYCSVFGDCWVDDDSGRTPRPARQCPADWIQYVPFPQAGPVRR